MSDSNNYSLLEREFTTLGYVIDDLQSQIKYMDAIAVCEIEKCISRYLNRRDALLKMMKQELTV